ncbi:hypothetical protein [Cellulomonas iranensis]|uniref:hypothetical protein n=1 Tax=Cellulomonas iranensis TaxID=76862 RepID=UPI000B3C39E9|nr:hypothetical protein [Cellulomonas iranensis]
MTDQITTPEALDALPVGTAGVDGRGRPFVITVGVKGIDGVAWLSGSDTGWIALRSSLAMPVTIRHRPDAPAPSAEDRELLALLDDTITRVPRIGGAGAIYEAELLAVLRAARSAFAARQLAPVGLDLAAIATTLGATTGWSRDDALAVLRALAKPGPVGAEATTRVSTVVPVPGLSTRELVLHDDGRVSWRDARGYDVAVERAVLDETPEVPRG